MTMTAKRKKDVGLLFPDYRPPRKMRSNTTWPDPDIVSERMHEMVNRGGHQP